MARDALENAGWISWQKALKKQSSDRCVAAPQLFANVELAVFIEVHTWHSTGTRVGLGPNQFLTENPFQNLDSL